MSEAIPFGVIGLTLEHSAHEGFEVIWVHLGVPSHDRGDIVSLLERGLVAGDDSGANAQITGVTFADESGVGGRLNAAPRAVFASVVHDNDGVDEAWHRAEGAGEQGRFIISGDDHGNAGTIKHVSQVPDRNRADKPAANLGRKRPPVFGTRFSSAAYSTVTSGFCEFVLMDDWRPPRIKR